MTVAWWDDLPADFHRQRDGTEIDADHRLLVHGSAVLDRVIRTGLGSAIGFALARTMVQHHQRERERMKFYARYADRADANAVFAPPLKDLRVTERAIAPYGDIPRTRLTFESPFVPLHPELVGTYTKFRRNGTAEAEHWTHDDGPRPTLIVLHGFLAHPYWFNARMFYLNWFWKAGYDVLLVKMPFHGPRAGLLDPFSGYGWFAHGIGHLNEAMLHAVHDVRAWMDWLEDYGAPSMGLTGYSLGGYISSLTAVADDRPAFVIPNSPVVTPIDMARDWQPTRALIAAGLSLKLFDPKDLRHATALHSPITYQPKIDASRVLVIGGAGDRLTAPRFVRLLHHRWPGSRLTWFPGNHLLHFGQREYLKLMRRHMDRCTGKVPA